MADVDRDAFRESLKRVAVALKEAGVPFALAGGYAGWARGAPEPQHDVDFVVSKADVAEAKSALTRPGLRIEEPPEDWLFKVFNGDVMVDVLFRLNGEAVEPSLLERADVIEVLSIQMPVLSANDVLGPKLNALDEHQCDFAAVLPTARALREQIDWQQLRRDVEKNDFAVAFVFLLDRLGITPADS
jgi:hypothetical protein